MTSFRFSLTDTHVWEARLIRVLGGLLQVCSLSKVLELMAIRISLQTDSNNSKFVSSSVYSCSSNIPIVLVDNSLVVD